MTVKLTPYQKSALQMLAGGHIPRQGTIYALISKGLAEGPVWRPSLTPAGRHTAEHGELPHHG